MFKLIKKLFKVVTAIAGVYAAITTLYWARVGISRGKKELRENWDVYKNMSLNELVYYANDAVYDEMIEEEEKYKEFIDK